ncbi:MLO-like protein 10 isoform X2 [Wolffia australiana]
MGNSRELDRTPTWAVASICTLLILISIALEKILHRLGKWFTERRKKSLFEALEKVKAELMILGFISLLLSFGQSYIARICIPERIAGTMLPCRIEDDHDDDTNEKKEHGRLLADILGSSHGPVCAKGNVPLISVSGIHQLHIFVFFLAVFHVICSATTMALGRAKIRCWKDWERETLSSDSEFSNDPTRFRFVHQTTFVRQHIGFWDRVPSSLYIVSFFRQFFRSVRKADYLAMRHGFISAHLGPASKFDFQKYIKRSLEDDFTVVVGISPILWGSAVIFLLLNVGGWQTLFWVSLTPLFLQAIITQMAIDITEKHVIIRGIPLVQLTDQHFWFRRPDLILFFIHFTLFQNAFQITYFLWIWYEFGLTSCFNDNLKMISARLGLGVGVQILCSYVTLPLYALVSQMGSRLKRSIFDEQTAKALRKWHMGAKRRHNRSGSSGSPSPAHPLRRLKTAAGRLTLSTTPSQGQQQHLLDFPIPEKEAEEESAAQLGPQLL